MKVKSIQTGTTTLGLEVSVVQCLKESVCKCPNESWVFLFFVGFFFRGGGGGVVVVLFCFVFVFVVVVFCLSEITYVEFFL